MTRLPIAYAIATLFLSCGSDKSKITHNEIRDTTKNTISEPPEKFESTDSPVRYPLRLTVHESSNWNLKIDSVTDRDFDQGKKEIYREKKINGDSLISAFSTRFKDAIILTDSCCILKGQDKDLKLCQRRPSNDKAWTGYNGIDFDHGYLIIMEWGWETWSFIIFNPITRQYRYTSNEPRFIDNDLIYSAGNYYTEGQFQIINLKENKYFGFESFNWELSGFYQNKNSIFMEFTFSRLGVVTKKYLKVTFD